MSGKSLRPTVFVSRPLIVPGYEGSFYHRSHEKPVHSHRKIDGAFAVAIRFRIPIRRLTGLSEIDQ
jgi:hypothetical protein